MTEFRYKNQTLSFATGPGFYSQEGKGTKEARFSFCTHNLTEIKNGMKVLKRTPIVDFPEPDNSIRAIAFTAAVNVIYRR